MSRMKYFLERVEGDNEFHELLESVLDCREFHIDRRDGYLLMRLKEFIEKNLPNRFEGVTYYVPTID